MNEKQLLSMTHDYPGMSIQEILKQRMPPELLLSDGSEYPHKGELETASGLISTGTGSVGLKAIFPNPSGFLVNGASSIIRLPERNDSAFLIPQSASFEQLDKRFIYKVAANNLVLSVPIPSNSTDDGKFFIVRDALKGGDRVILTGITKLKDSMQVVPVVVNADSVYRTLVTNLP
jgi:membrane fusion protein (multidrug efflux system)